MAKGSKETGLNFKEQIVILVTGAFAFTAALFWNNAIKDSINHFIPAADSWYGEITVALLVTVIAVIATYILTKAAAKE